MSALAAAPGGTSRRRAALLAETSEHPPEPRPCLSLADVERLQGDPSADVRASIAAKLGLDYDRLATDQRTGPLAGAILNLLVKDVEKNVRSALASAIANSTALPPGVARRLAADDIDVARPILEQSPVLDDEQLIEIVRTHAMQYALAVAGRQNLAAKVCDVLVETGGEDVVARLVGNHTSKLSLKTLERIVDDYADHDQVHERLVRRPELPYELVDQLVGMIGQRLEWELVSSRKVSSEDARRLVDAVREHTTISMTARDHNVRRDLAKLRQQFFDGEIDAVAALKALRDGEIARFEGIMSLLADQDVAVVRRSLYGMDKRGTAALCLRAGFGAGHYLAVRMALDLAQSGVAPTTRQSAYTTEALEFLRNQYERLRARPDVVEKLLQGA